MTVEKPDDIAGLLACGRIVRAAFERMKAAAVPGISTLELDAIGAAYLSKHDTRSAPQLFYDFPGATCISVNEHAAHGIPNDYRLQAGDMVNIDVSAEHGGYVTDMGESFVVSGSGDGDYGAQERICEGVKDAVTQAIAVVRAGQSLNAVGQAVQLVADRMDYAIVRNLGSHGVGESIHEPPSYIPFDNPRERRHLAEGLVFTIEPFFSSGTDWVDQLDDGWTLAVPRGTLVAQFEHTVIVTEGEPIVVTA